MAAFLSGHPAGSEVWQAVWMQVETLTAAVMKIAPCSDLQFICM